MPDADDAVKLVTDPANVTRMHAAGPEPRFAVKQARVLRALRSGGAGKAEARELALKAVEQAGGAAEVVRSRGVGATGGKGAAEAEEWWVPKSAVRFEG